MVYILLIAFAYLVFVFLAEDFNPILITKNPMKRGRWRLGRSGALATIVAGLCTLIFMHLFELGRTLAAVCFFGLALLLWLPSIVKYKKSQVWQ